MSKEDFLRSQLDRVTQIAEGRRVDIEGRQAIIDALERLLLELTPGDSEFHGNPGRCAQWAQGRLTAADALALAMEKIERLATAHLDNPTGTPREFMNVTVVLRQVAHNALREYREGER